MKARWLPNPALTLMLAILWLLLNNTLSFGQFLLGLFLGWAIPLLVRGFLIEGAAHTQAAAAVRVLAQGAL